VVDNRETLISGFAVHLTPSRAIPGTRTGRIEYIGRGLHEELTDALGTVLNDVARKIPRLLHLDVRLFDEDPVRRRRFSDSLDRAGWTPSRAPRSYSHTLVLTLGQLQEDVINGLSKRVRAKIRTALNSPLLRFAPVSDFSYADRIRSLNSLTFARTGGVVPRIDLDGILHDSAGSRTSLLIGAYARDRSPPDDLVALQWARLNGDHAVLEINASERSPLFKKLSPGFALMSCVIGWAIQQRAQWLDLGGLTSPHPEPDDPMHGIIFFKTSFSKDYRAVAEEWHLDPTPWLAVAAGAVRSFARAVSIPRRAYKEQVR